jgi:hypothetical protein
LRKLVFLISCCLVLAEKAVSEDSTDLAQVPIGGTVQVHVQEDGDSVFHVQVVAPMYLDKEQFEILSLHSHVEGERTLEVGVVVEEVSDLMLEAWIHVVGIEELRRHSLHAYYSVPCPGQENSGECRKEYVFRPIDFVDGN